MRLFFEKERKGRYFTWFEARIFLNVNWLDVKSNYKTKKKHNKKCDLKQKTHNSFVFLLKLLKKK